MQKTLLALTIVSLLAAPQVLANDKIVSLENHESVAITANHGKSQEELHESDEAEIHENEKSEGLDDDIKIKVKANIFGTPMPSETPIATPKPEATSTPTPSPSPTGSPLASASISTDTSILEAISKLLKEILSYLQHTSVKAEVR